MFHKPVEYRKCMKEIEAKAKGKTVLEKMDITCAILKRCIPYYFWVGFYLPKKNYLELGRSRGPPACNQIPYTGVCGEAAKTKKPVTVSDVEKFSGHVVCDPRSKSEISLPIFDATGSLIAVFDVDSEEKGSFNETDQEWLERILKKIFSVGPNIHN
jgi:L-methionine (R)-S-oxide reductase